MGAIDEELDRECIRRFSSPEKELLKFLEKKLPAAGNGTEEIRNWLVAHGAAGGRRFELVDSLPVPPALVGRGFAPCALPASPPPTPPAPPNTSPLPPPTPSSPPPTP